MKDILYYINQNRPLKYFNVVLLFFLLNGIAAKANCRFDLSRDHINSLSSSTEKVLSSLKEPVIVEAYISKEVPGEILSLLLPIISQLEEMNRIGGDKILLQVITPSTELEMNRAQSRGIQGIPIEESKVDEIKQRLGYFGIYLQMGDKSSVISLVQEGQIVEDLEYKFLRELKKMMKKDTKSGLGFVQADGTMKTFRWQRQTDQDKNNLFGFRTLLEKDLGLITDVDLKDSVKPNIKVLILTGIPRLTEVEKYNLDQYIMQGGNLILMLKGFDFQLEKPDPRLASLGLGSPGGGFATVPEADLKQMNNWLAHYGFSVNGEILFEPELAAAADDIRGEFIQKLPNPAWAVYLKENGQIVGEIPSMISVRQLIFPWFSSINIHKNSQEAVAYTTLVRTSPKAIKRNASSLELRELIKIGKAPGDVVLNEELPVAAIAQGKFKSLFTQANLPKGVKADMFRQGQASGTKSTIIILGTPYLASDILLQNKNNAQIFRINFSFLANLIEAAYGDTDLLAARSKIRYLDTLIQTGKPFELIFSWFFILSIPLAIGIYGIIRLYHRNKRRGITEGVIAE
jgi:ABC-type uncharacterized transport system involved in gliding motility auxiliary subunit